MMNNLITLLLSRMMGAISNPSIVTFGIFAPARLAIVGKRSSVTASCDACQCKLCRNNYHHAHMCTSYVLPGVILPGHRAIPGTLCPPSQVVPLPHRRRPAFPPLVSLASEGLHCQRTIKDYLQCMSY